jgi:hypothetical protein
MVTRPTDGVLCSVNQRVPSGALAMVVGKLPALGVGRGTKDGKTFAAGSARAAAGSARAAAGSAARAPRVRAAARRRAADERQQPQQQL